MRPAFRAVTGALALAAAGTATPAAAHITRIEILKVQPAFAGKSFGSAGTFERVTGRAYGEVDPKLPANAVIQDIALAPRNARGMVEYSTDIDIVRPADAAKSNNVLLMNIINRGNKGALTLFNADVPGSVANVNALQSAGDGWLQSQGYTLVYFGWQGDVLPGDDRMLFNVPVAHGPNNTAIEGVVRSELIFTAPMQSINLGGGWFTTGNTDSYPTVNTDNTVTLNGGFKPTLTVRARESAPREVIPTSAWHFGTCDAGNADPKMICYPAGFTPGHIYEVIYRARDPKVLGLGYAAARDLGAFLKTQDKDSVGTPNPVVHGRDVKTLVMGSSQSGRFIRTMLMLGFNKSETGGIAYDAALPHIGGGLIGLNIRFAAPGRAWGSVVEHTYPAYDFPFTYARQTDPITGRTQGVLDRCSADHTCPRIFHAATALEIWDGRQSLGLTDPMGMHDAPEPANVRTYIRASTQHSPAAMPLPKSAPFGTCSQQGNPNPHLWTMRALLESLTAWVRYDKAPPKSNVPRIADGTLVAADQVRFPVIPANTYGGVSRPAMPYLAQYDPLHVFERGPQYRPAELSGIITIEPPRQGSAAYGVLVPQVDADGNDIAGIRSLYAQVPIGTYTGWNTFRPDWFPNGPCELTGAFVPFAATKAEREQTGDTRPSLEERYPTKKAYVNAVREAADRLIIARFLRPDDANRLIAEAEAAGVRAGP